jgi:3D (Asp-Asp-Asp) domain-containing protein
MNTQGYNLFQRIFYIISFVLPLSINSQERLPVPSDTVDVITYRLKGRTASGLYSTKIKEPFVAVSRDLLKKYPLHSYIELYDCKWKGRYKVLDIMNKRHTKTVDIYYNGMKNNLVKCRCRT